MSKLLIPHLTHLKAAGYSGLTITSRERVLRCADRRLPYGLDTPTTDELADFFAEGGWSGWTLATYFRHVAGFYRWASAGKNPHLEFNPAEGLISPKNPDADPDPVTDDEVRYALESSDAWWQLAIVLAAYAGARAGEAGRMRREHITEQWTTFVHGKGDRTKKVPTHPEIWRRVCDLPLGPLFPTARGQEVNLSHRARDHFNKLGMPDVHLHRFRHWYATMLLRQGVDIRTVQELMRHRSIKTTMGYLLITDGQRRFAVSTLPVLTLSPLQEAA